VVERMIVDIDMDDIIMMVMINIIVSGIKYNQ